MAIQREWDGIWIPKEIYLSKEVSHTSKMIFLEIHSFTSKGRQCFVSNEHLAEFVGISKRMVSKNISALIDAGWIELVSFDGQKRYLQSCYEEKFRTPMNKSSEGDGTKVLGGVEQKFQYTNNNIPPPNTSNKEDDAEASSAKNDYKVCMDIYFEFYKAFYQIKPKVTGADGKALKQIITYLKTLPGEHPPDYLLKLIFDNWKKLDPFTQQQTSLTKINHFLNGIIGQLKAGKQSKSSALHSQLDEYADTLRKEGQTGNS